MARIETYTAQQGLNPGNTPDARLVNPVADELVNIGKQVTAVANTLIQRNEQKENFKVENDYRRLQLELGAEMQTKAAEMQPDGTGFHDKFVGETFKPKRDQFLAGVPDRLKPKFEALLSDEGGADATEWSIRAAQAERDQNYVYQRDEIKLAADQTAVAISMQPEAYDDLLGQGLSLIDASSLPTPEKDKLKRDWENTAQIAMLNQLLETDPQGVFRELGYDPRQLSPTTQFEVLSRAVQWQESADNPNAVSGKGAVGLMQVMPPTAREIAAKLGDTQFPAGENDTAVAAYLTNPYVNKRYGEFYLKEQLRTFANTRDPLEAALVAYNAGPSVAQKWVESGYDDKVLPKETRDYKTNIMASIKSSPVKGDPSSVKFVGLGEGVSKDLQGRVADAFATVGQTKVKVNSGYRSKEKNAEVGGADKSQHLDGNAMDIDVSGMKITERIELIKALSNSGVTGIGVYANSIHADLGGRRAWGPDHHDTSIPKWAQPVLGQHLNGTTPPPRAVNQRYASLPYDTRQSFTSKADQLVTSTAAAAAKSSSVEKVEVKRSMENNLALLRTTGQGDPSFNATNVATILGEDDYVTYMRKQDVAQQTFTATSGISTMLPEDMEARFLEYTPDPASPDFADQQAVQAAVQKEVDRVTRLRASHPDQAALEFPEVKGVYTALQEQLVSGDAQPAQVQEFVAQMLDTQGQLGIAPAARAPVTSEWGMQIGRALSRVPEISGKNAAEVRNSVQVQYEELQKYFGDYTDEVVIYALSEYKGLSKPTADLINGYMKAISVGGDPFRKRQVDQAIDNDQVEGFGNSRIGFGGSLFDPFGVNAGAAEETGLSPEEVLRQQNTTEE
jgi:stress response protein YsnF